MEEEEEEGRKIIDTKTIQPPPPHVPGSVTVPPPPCVPLTKRLHRSCTRAHRLWAPEMSPPGRVPDHAFWRGCVSSGCHPVRHSGESRPVPLHPCSC